MLEVRPVPVVKNRVHRCQIRCVRIQPRIDVIGLDRYDAPVVTCCSDLRRRLIRDGREREQVCLARGAASRPQAGDMHELAVIRTKFQYNVFVSLMGIE